MRFDPPVKVIYRVVQRSTMIADVSAPAGTVVGLSLTGANNDPRHFADPDRFDIRRLYAQELVAFYPDPPLARATPLAAGRLRRPSAPSPKPTRREPPSSSPTMARSSAPGLKPTIMSTPRDGFAVSAT